LGKGELSADMFAGKYHRCNRGDNNRDCRNEEKEEKIAVIGWKSCIRMEGIGK
jgi:hypothetical protein